MFNKKIRHQKNHHGKMKVCCTWMERCSKSIKKGKSCKKLNKKCKKSERITWWNGKNCKWVKVKNGRHKRCCSYKNYCVGKKCSKKIKNVKMFKELELLEKELVNGEKEKQIVKKENVVQLLLKYQKESIKLFQENVNGKEKQFVKNGFMDVDGEQLENQEEENIVVNI